MSLNSKYYSFELTEEQQDIVSRIRAFAQSELLPLVREYDIRGEFPMQLFERLTHMGFYAMNIPKEYGGRGISRTTWMLAVEELARVDAGFAFSFMVPGGHFRLFSIACQNESKRRAFAQELISGKMAAFCMTDAGSGSDAAAAQTTAVYDPSADEYIINGTKGFITNGGLASYFITAAMTDMGDGTQKLSLFLVERSRGVRTGKVEDKMGLRLSNTTEVIFDHVRVPADHLLGEKGKGLSYCLNYMEQVRAMDAAFAVGIAQNALDLAVDYAKQRVTMGRPIIRHQAVATHLANMQMDVDAMQCMVSRCAGMIDSGTPLGTLACSCKLFASEGAVRVTNAALQIFGAVGYTRDCPVEKLVRDARIFPIFEGTNEIVRTVSAGILERQ